MKSLLLGVVGACFVAANSYASTVTTTITFDDLGTGTSYIESGYLFQGYMESRNYSPRTTPPVALLFGTKPVTISRVDGQPFTLDAFHVVSGANNGNHWRMDNEYNSGFSITRDGQWKSTQWSSYVTTNIQSLTISDPLYSSGNTYRFDNFVFTHTSAVPVPAAVWLFGSGLVGLVVMARR